MIMSLPKGFDRTNAIVAAAVWLTVLFVYNLTKAPTLTFWDCGEFIASCFTLGIPHPPGTPAYILVGRLFGMTPFVADVAARLNFLTVLCSSLAALFAYLIAVRVMRPWFDAGTSAYSRLLIYAGAASGTLFLAFGLTEWSNSIEAEVYGMSMAMLMAMVWLTMICHEHRETPLGDNLMLAVVYIGFLGIGVHMTTFLALPVCAVVFILRRAAPRWTWFALAAWVVAELFLLLALSSRPDELPYWLPILLAFIFYVFYTLSFEKVPLELLLAGVAFALACAPVAGVFTKVPAQLLTTISVIALAALTAYALYGLVLWFRSRKSEDAAQDSHLLVLALFVISADLGIGLILSHALGYAWFLILTAVLAVAVVAAVGKYIRWPVLIALAGSSLIMLGVHEWLYGSLAALGLIILTGLVWRAEGWKSATLIVTFAALGFSVFAVLPIRSSLHPTINENNPSRSMKATIDTIERKQYGSQSMVERMFERRGTWQNQFGVYARMGFWGFFREQYGLSGPLFLILLVLGALGFWEACRRRPEHGTILLLLFLLATVGLILYMNFADGTRQSPTGADYLEVRDRDYFFTPGFMLFGLMMGVGLTAFVQYLREMAKGFGRVSRSVILTSALVVFLLPVYTVRANYFTCDRSHNYLAYDYAYNILMSADENAVLFTAGDNDTFPLWCVQEAFGVRKDVKNVNLSLANLDWYIKQIRDNMGLELGWTDEQIDSLRPYRLPDGRTFRVQDQVIDAVVSHNWGRVPVNFSFTVPASARRLVGRSADSLLELHAMSYRLTDSARGLRVDTKHSLQLFRDVFQYRGWNDPTVYKDISSLRQTGNITGCMIQVAQSLVDEGNSADAESLLLLASRNIEYSQPAVEMLASLYADRGAVQELTSLALEQPDIDSLQMTTLLGRAYRGAQRNGEAETILVDLLDRHTGYRPALNELIAMYISTQQVEKVATRLQKWVNDNPKDAEIRQALEQLMQQLRKATDSARGDSQ
jgi:hypothetical protein